MRKVAGYGATLLVLGGLWVLVTATGLVSDQILPPVPDLADAAQQLQSDGQLTTNLASTALRIVLSFALGVVLGIPLGSLLWRVPFIGAALRPYLSAIYSVPLVVFYPFFVVTLGINDWPVVLLTAVMTTIPIALNTQIGLATAPGVLLNVGRSLERTSLQVFRQIRLPAAWPNILGGIKLSMVYAVVGVVSMEFVAAHDGLGNRIQYFYETFDVASMYVFILLTLLLSGCCIGGVLAIESITTHGRS
jgi:NitT/TauT family transport system permease protein